MLQSRNILTWGIVLLAFGAFVLALVEKGIPNRSRLTEVVGQLKSLDKTTSKGGGLSAVRFSLATDHREFHLRLVSLRGRRSSGSSSRSWRSGRRAWFNKGLQPTAAGAIMSRRAEPSR